MPLSDTLAIQASGFAHRDAGYIDDVESGVRGVNWGNASGGRLAALWQPSERVSLQLSALIQGATHHGLTAVELGSGFGDLQQSTLKGSGWTYTRAESYTALLNVKLASSLELTSLTGYNSFVENGLTDITLPFSFLDTFYGPTAAYSATLYTTNRGFSEELRLNAHLGQAIDWLTGGFYSHTSSPVSSPIQLNDSTTGAATGTTILRNQWQQWYQETAAFTNLTVHFNPRFDLQLGGRGSEIRQFYQETDSGDQVMLFEGVPSPAVYPGEWSKANVFTYLVTPSFKISQEFMTYVRLASGYQTGGPNANNLGIYASQVPHEFGPAKTRNYEWGIKGDLFDHKLTFDSSVYYIGWKDIQVPS